MTDTLCDYILDLALCLRGRTLILSLELSEVDLRHGGHDHLDAGLLPRVPVVGLGLRVHLVLVGGAVGRGPNGTVGLHALAGRLIFLFGKVVKHLNLIMY